MRYRWGDAAIDSVSSFGVPVRSRPTAVERRAVERRRMVVDAEVAHKLLTEADGVLLVIDASADATSETNPDCR